MNRVIVAAALLVVVSQAAWASAWSPMARANYIYFDQASTGAPDITVSPVTGLPYVVFQSAWDPGNGNNIIIGFAKGTKIGRTIDWSWSRTHPIEVSPRGHKSLGPAIAVGSRNGQEEIHVLWWDHIGTEDLLYSRSIDGGNTWSAPTNLSSSATVGNGHYSAAADAQGNVYVAWSDWYGSPNANGLNIWLRKFDGATQTWEAKRQIESDITSKSQNPRIILDTAGNVHCAWTDRLSNPRRFSYTYSTNAGATWAAVQTIMTFSTDYDLGPVGLAVASDGTAYAAMATGPAYGYTGPSSLYLSSKSPGGAWSAGQVVQGSDPCANPYMAADSSGHVFLSWLKYQDGAFDIIYMQRNSLGWSGASNATRDGLWKGYTGGHLAVDPANGFVYVATDDTRDDLYHQAWVTSLDLREPPLPVANLTKQSGDSQVVLSWRNQDEPDIGAVRVVCRTDRYPASPTDGTIAGEKASRCNENDSFVHDGVTNGTTYYYAVYARDDYGNYSSPAFVTATPGLSSCRGAKNLPDGTRADLSGQIVTAVFASDGCIYVEEPDRSSGIRVAWSGTGLVVGDSVSLSGAVVTRVVSNYASERVVNATSVTKLASPGPPKPLAMGCASVGGAAVGNAPGVKDAIGTNNMGLLVKIAGRVTRVLGSYLFVDDGSSVPNVSGSGPEVGVMVRCAVTPSVAVGNIVSVTGVIEGSIPTGWTANRRYIRTRDAGDLRLFYSAPTTGAISGTVRDSQGAAVVGALVSTNTGGYTATTGAGGVYALSDVEQGTYSVTASRAGYQPQTVTGIVVTTGQTTTVDFTLTSIPVEVLSNGSFEDGFADFWGGRIASSWNAVCRNQSSADNTEWMDYDWSSPHSLSQQVYVSLNGGESGLRQTVTGLTPGKSFRFSCYANQSLTSCSCWIAADASGGTALPVRTTSFANTAGVWNYQEVTGTVGTSGSVSVFVWAYQQSSPTAYCYLDDASLMVW